MCSRYIYHTQINIQGLYLIKCQLLFWIGCNYGWFATVVVFYYTSSQNLKKITWIILVEECIHSCIEDTFNTDSLTKMT